MAVADPEATVSGDAKAGLVRVVYGGGKGTSELNQGLASVPGDAEPNDYFGDSLAAVDYTKDGCTDLVVGTSREDVGSATDAGTVDVIYGSLRRSRYRQGGTPPRTGHGLRRHPRRVLGIRGPHGRTGRSRQPGPGGDRGRRESGGGRRRAGRGHRHGCRRGCGAGLRSARHSGCRRPVGGGRQQLRHAGNADRRTGGGHQPVRHAGQFLHRYALWTGRLRLALRDAVGERDRRHRTAGHHLRTGHRWPPGRRLRFGMSAR
ncbi:FG-GAP repeat protein [Streptomyces sp. NPDC048385]|uniref:FG-GAP repeat protein n=1 Tax=unclassified Streptomyces TaxID=2593676 RepID=UPI003423B678